ncbi:MAG: bifunctional glutamate N-acetyltransferase/amino-acid acetyltransferase ArgJ, partial [Chloroflexi bacterium]|nr:bifunctional glutamate N-acetyltransferase/amino-acid acetyltransferase ArgJ [Chloroflexota bacterium]
MATSLTLVEGGSVTSPKGFLAGAIYAGLKTYGESPLDLGVLVSDRTAAAAGTFTTNKIKSPSVVLSQRHIASGQARAVVANSGCANCCVGEQGLKDAQETVALAAKRLGLPAEEVLMCSTGIIGVELPMSLVRTGLQRIEPSTTGGHDFARAIMTTDTRPKETAISLQLSGATTTIAGCAKGAAMIHPQMATMLCFLATDASVEPAFLQKALRDAVAGTFNMISVDGDTSTNDSVILLANKAAGGALIQPGTRDGEAFQEAVLYVCTYLAQQMVQDGEGASKLLEVVVEGARILGDARLAARAIASSNLVKAAVHGNDPNWGRVMMALGKSGATMEENHVDLFLNEVCVMQDGLPIPFFRDAVVATMRAPRVR